MTKIELGKSRRTYLPAARVTLAAFSLLAGRAALEARSRTMTCSRCALKCREVEQQIKVISRQIEAKSDADAVAAAAAPKVTVNDKGFTLASLTAPTSSSCGASCRSTTACFSMTAGAS